jgi:hypothetical protein
MRFVVRVGVYFWARSANPSGATDSPNCGIHDYEGAITATEPRKIHPMKPRFAREYFMELDRVLAARSAVVKSRHKGDTGDSRERILIEMLNDHLPIISRAHQGGAILDYRDNLSAQTDIIIYSNWSPLLKQSGKPIFLAPGCYAAIEVKSVVTQEVLIKYFEESRNLQQMRKFVMSLDEHGVYPPVKSSKKICTGIFGYESRIKTSSVFELFRRMEKAGWENIDMPDFICINGTGCWTRLRSEDTAAFYSTDGKTTLEQAKQQIKYVVDDMAFGKMLETILGYVSYVGPVRNFLSLYVNHFYGGET